MEHIHSNTNFTERKRGQHLSLDERGIIQSLKKEGRSNHYIADRLNCSVSTIGYELSLWYNIMSIIAEDVPQTGIFCKTWRSGI